MWRQSRKKREAAGNSRLKSTAEYVNELAKLVPSVELKVGNTFASAKSGKTLTINPQLLEKMQSDKLREERRQKRRKQRKPIQRKGHKPVQF